MPPPTLWSGNPLIEGGGASNPSNPDGLDPPDSPNRPDTPTTFKTVTSKASSSFSAVTAVTEASFHMSVPPSIKPTATATYDGHEEPSAIPSILCENEKGIWIEQCFEGSVDNSVDGDRD